VSAKDGLISSRDFVGMDFQVLYTRDIPDLKLSFCSGSNCPSKESENS
jgi:hypothetical protein